MVCFIQTGFRAGRKSSSSTLTSAPPLTAVLAAGVLGDGSGNDPGCVLRPNPSSVPEQAVEAAALAHLLLGGGVRPHPHRPLDLHHGGVLLGAGPGQQPCFSQE